MNVLAIETSARTLSLALCENSSIAAESFINDGFVHSEKLFDELGGIFERSGKTIDDIDRIAVSTGPGSFTGIRVGMVLARALAQVKKLDIVGIDALSILEAGHSNRKFPVSAILDAGRGELYMKEHHEIVIKSANKYFMSLDKDTKRIFVGSGALMYKAVIKKIFGSNADFVSEELNYPRASVLALMAEKMKPQKLLKVKPVYVRKSWAEENIR